ncbi:hypothetical protein FQA39_LY00070 [Lamprigera yunnana]|nr:hypothetical protein FQA39_LY00070 [Lamprigera yunnana]
MVRKVIKWRKKEYGIFRLVIEGDRVRLEWDTWIRRNLEGLRDVNEATVHVVTTLGAGNLEYFLWRAIGKINCNYGGTAPNVSGMHEH